MVWVRSEYAGELAVVSAWLAAFVPWNITYSTLSGLGSVLFVRFPFVQVRYAFGIPLAERITITTPIGARAYQQGHPIAAAYTAWAVGAAVVAAAVVLGVLLYRYEERFDRTRVDVVRVIGGLLALAAVVLAGATWLLWTRGFPGVPIPIGLVILSLLGGVLLAARRE